MPTVKVQGPDGKIYTVEAPEGASDQDVLEFVASQAQPAAQAPPARASAPQDDEFRPGLRGAINRGMGLGATDYMAAAGKWAGDKVGAGLEALTGRDLGVGDKTYEQSLREVRRGNEAFREESPVQAYGGEMLGAVASPVLATKAYDWGAQAARPVTGSVTAMVERMLDKSSAAIGRNLPAWLRVGVHGAADAGLYGAITAQNEQGGIPSFGDVASSAGSDAGAGFVGGNAIKYGGRALGWAGGKVADGAQVMLDKLPFNQASGAGREFAKTMERAGITEQQLIANRQRLGPRANAVDAAGYQDPETGVWLGGRAAYQQADMLANAPGKTPDLAERVLKPRASQAGTDLLTSIRRDISPREFQKTFDDISTEMQEGAAPLYKEAYAANQSMSSPTINRILNTPAGKDAMAYTLERMQNRMSRMAVPDKELTEQMNELVEAGKMDRVKGGVASGLKLETLDHVKRALGQREEQLKRLVISGKATKDQVNEIRDLRRDLTSELDRLDVTAKAGPNSLKPEGGLFKQARAKWSDNTALQEAMESGEQFMKGDRDLVVKDFQKLPPGEQEMYFVGMAKAVQNSVEQTGTVPARLKNILNKENGTRKTLQAILPPDKFDSFLNTIAGISRKSETARMLGGSPTAPRQEYASDMGADLGGAVIEGAKGNFGTAAQGLFRSTMNMLGRPSEGMRDELGRLYLDPDAFPDAVNALRTLALVNTQPRMYGTLQPGAGQNLLRALPLGIK